MYIWVYRTKISVELFGNVPKMLFRKLFEMHYGSSSKVENYVNVAHSKHMCGSARSVPFTQIYNCGSQHLVAHNVQIYL